MAEDKLDAVEHNWDNFPEYMRPTPIKTVIEACREKRKIVAALVKNALSKKQKEVIIPLGGEYAVVRQITSDLVDFYPEDTVMYQDRITMCWAFVPEGGVFGNYYIKIILTT
jgi:hypothetical protein